MKMLTDLLGRSLQAFQFPVSSSQFPEKRSLNWPLVTGDWLLFLITLISIFCLPCLAFGIEPIGTIGQPRPEQHAFLSNETILRAVPTHIQVVDAHTGAVVDEFGERTYYSDVVFSPTATHLAILNHSGDPRTTTITIWDVNAREQVMRWQFESRVRYAAFSPTDSVFATSFKDGIHLWNWQAGAFIGTMERINFPSKQAIVFSTDGHHLLIVAKHSSVELWNVKTLRLEGRFDGHTGNLLPSVLMALSLRRLRQIQLQSVCGMSVRDGCYGENGAVVEGFQAWHSVQIVNVCMWRRKLLG